MARDSDFISSLLCRLSTMFKFRYLGKPSFFLRIQTISIDGGLLLSQRRYMNDILRRAGMSDCKYLANIVSCYCTSSMSKELFDNPTRYHSLVGAL